MASVRSGTASMMPDMRLGRFGSPRPCWDGASRCCPDGRTRRWQRCSASIATRTMRARSGRSRSALLSLPRPIPRPGLNVTRRPLAEAAARGVWQGLANQLSSDHTEWVAIDDASVATTYPGRSGETAPVSRQAVGTGPRTEGSRNGPLQARSVMLARRSAVAFDEHSSLDRDAFFSMLERLRPPVPPWDAIDWPPHVHLVLFVHRVEGLVPGVYAYLRDEAVQSEWRKAMRPDFFWEPVDSSAQPGPDALGEPNGLFLLVPIDCQSIAQRLSCDQEIAADGYFSLAMVARMEASLRQQGEWFYRRLFWECGLIGQVLYLEAEAVGGRATGIGCFYDDPVHETLGLTGHAWQSLYHFSMGIPIEDGRLTTESGYPWERA